MSIVCKTLEHVIHSSAISHFERNNILTDCQHGFRKRRSYETQLILTIEDLARGLNDKQQIDAVRTARLFQSIRPCPPPRSATQAEALWGAGKHPELDRGLPVCNSRDHHQRLKVTTLSSYVRCPSRHSLGSTPIPGLYK